MASFAFYGANIGIDFSGINVGYGNFSARLDFATLFGAGPGTKSAAAVPQNPAAARFNPNVSVVDYMNMHGMPSDLQSRERKAAEFGIQGEAGSAAKNLALLSHLQGTT